MARMQGIYITEITVGDFTDVEDRQVLAIVGDLVALSLPGLYDKFGGWFTLKQVSREIGEYFYRVED